MKTKKIGIVTLALALISLGMLLLLNNFLELDVSRILSIFWPLIIIIYGVELIITRVVLQKKEENIPSRLDGVSLFLLVIIVIISLVTSNVNIHFLDIDAFPNFSTYYKYDSKFSRDYTIDCKDKNELIVDNSHGNVEIRRGMGEKIELEAHVNIKHNDENYAQKIFNNIIEIDENRANSIQIRSNRNRYLSDNKRVKSISVSYYLTIPEGLRVDVVNRYGFVDVEDVAKSVKINNSHGKVAVKNVDGDLDVENSYGNVDIYKIGGKAKLTNSHGTVTAKAIGNELDIRNPYGNVDISDVKGKVQIRNSHNKVRAREIDGNIEIDSDYSSVIVEDVIGNLSVDSSHAGIDLANIEGDVDASNKYGHINLSDASKSMKLRTRNGNINVRSKSLIDGSVNIENEYGNVVIDIPDEQQGSFKAFTNYGKIDTSFEFNIDKDINEQSVDERIGEDSTTFYLRTKNGNIRIDSN